MQYPPSPSADAAVPLSSSWEVELGQVVTNDLVALDVYRMTVRAEQVVARALPGQFLMVRGPGMRVLLPRAMAPIRFNPEGTADIYYRVVGPGTREMADMGPGQAIVVIGPLGTPVPAAGDLAVVGRGVGITPLLPLAESAVVAGYRVHSYLSARVPELLLDLEDFSRLGPVATHVDSTGPGELVTAALEREVHDGYRPAQIVVAGSRRLARRVAHLAGVHGFRAQVFVEEKMACGVGFCKGCVIGPHRRLICVEGPALPIEEVM